MNKVDFLRKMYPVGCKVELHFMDDPQAPPSGTVGEVITANAKTFVNLPLKKPFYIAVVFAAIAGGIAGFGNAAALAGGPVGILSFPLFIGEGFGYFVAAMLIALFGTAIAVYFFGYDKKYDQE